MSKTKFKRGDYVRKISGSWWEGYVVGDYCTEQTPDGVAVQLPIKNGPVQIYPAAALEHTEPGNICFDLLAALTAARNDALDAANAYMTEQYGLSALGHPVDRARILSKIKKETPNADK